MGQRQSPNGPAESPPARRPGALRWISLALGPIVLLIILLNLDTASLLDALGRARIVPLLVAAALMLPTLPLRALRWRLLLRDAEAPDLRYRDLLAVYAYSVFVGVITPGRVGEFAKTFHLTRAGMNLGSAAATVLLDRLFDIAVLLTIATIALFAITVPGLGSVPAIASMVAGLFLAGLGLWWLLCSPRMGRVWDRLSGPTAGPLLERIVGVRRDFCVAIADVSATSVVVSILLTLAAWAVTYYANYLLAQSLGLDIGYVSIVGISAIASLVAQLPISILGAGTRDAALIVILAPYGASTEQAVALSMLFLGITLYTGLVCGLSAFSPATRFGSKR